LAGKKPGLVEIITDCTGWILDNRGGGTLNDKINEKIDDKSDDNVINNSEENVNNDNSEDNCENNSSVYNEAENENAGGNFERTEEYTNGFGGGYQRSARRRVERRPVFAAEPTPARKVAEGAMLVAVAVIFGLSTAYLPVVWVAALFLWPVPIALMVRRFGFGFGLAGLLLTGVLLSLFIGPLGALTILISMGGVGLWYGFANRQSIKPWITIVTGVFIAAASTLVLLVLSSLISGLGLDDLTKQVEEFVEFYVSTMQKNGKLSAVLGTMTVEEYTVALQQYVLSMIPASLILMSMFEAGISYALNTYIFRRLGYAVEKLPPFTEWRLPWYTLWGLIVALFCALAAARLDNELYSGMLQTIATNIMYIYQPLLMLAGLTVVYWQAYYWRMPWLIFFVLVLVMFAFSVVAPAMIILGVADSIFDIRQLVRRYTNN
jgi:uncharacterized protein YybS (DUF2232 family)